MKLIPLLLAIICTISVAFAGESANQPIRPNTGPGSDLPAALRQEFYHAAITGDLAKAKELLAKEPLLVGARPDNCPHTPLTMAACRNQVEMVKFLIANKANIEDEDFVCGGSALGWSGWFGHPDVAAVLIAAGAEVNHPNRGGTTPLGSATFAKDYDCDDKSWKASQEDYAREIALLKENGGVIVEQKRTRAWPIVPGWDDPALEGFPKKTK